MRLARLLGPPGRLDLPKRLGQSTCVLDIEGSLLVVFRNEPVPRINEPIELPHELPAGVLRRPPLGKLFLHRGILVFKLPLNQFTPQFQPLLLAERRRAFRGRLILRGRSPREE